MARTCRSRRPTSATWSRRCGTATPSCAAGARLIEVLFRELFAGAVVHAVEGEDEIWLVESGPTRRLHVWERA
jgi:hypothetical protein